MLRHFIIRANRVQEYKDAGMKTIFNYVTDDSIIHLFLSALSDKDMQQITTETENGFVLRHDGPCIVYTKHCDPEMLELIFDDIPEFIEFDTFTFYFTNDFELSNGPEGYAAKYQDCIIAYATRKGDIVQIHNENGPAVITSSGVTLTITEDGTLFIFKYGMEMKWIQNGKAFREVGPTLWYVNNEVILLNTGNTVIPKKCNFSIAWKLGNHTINAPTLVKICKDMGLNLDILTLKQSIFPNPIDQLSFMQQIEKELEDV